MKPFFSVIMPAYNQAAYLDEAICSVLNQTHCDFELIVVDDGSTDETAAVAQKFQDELHYIYQTNQGLAGARNTGILHAKGKYIALLDSDDKWKTNFLQEMLALIEQYPETAVYYCSAQCIDEQGNELPQIAGQKIVPAADMFAAILHANFIIPSTTIIEREIALEADLFDTALSSCEDWDLWLRLLPQHTFIGTDKTLAYYRLHNNSLSANTTNMRHAAQAVVEKHWGPDDQLIKTWSPQKRQAYHGLYRYFAIISLLREQNWQATARFLRNALTIEPNITLDLDLFYELALGSERLGHRIRISESALKHNAICIEQLLSQLFSKQQKAEGHVYRSQAYATANYALGILAYNSGHSKLSRHFLLKALRFYPYLPVASTQIAKRLFKASIGTRTIIQFKNMYRNLQSRVTRHQAHETSYLSRSS